MKDGNMFCILHFFVTGGRLGEVLGLQWHQINFERSTILFSQMWDGVLNQVTETTKSRKDRSIPMNSIC